MNLPSTKEDKRFASIDHLFRHKTLLQLKLSKSNPNISEQPLAMAPAMLRGKRLNSVQ
jgi:hypothetical protein